MERIEIKSSPVKLLLLSLAAAAFVAFGVFLVFVVAAEADEDSLRATVIGWASIIFFGSGLIGFLFRLFDRRPRIVLDDEGIEDRSLGVGKIFWSDIEAAYLNDFVTSKFIALQIPDAEKYLQLASGAGSQIVSANQALDFEAFNINLVGLSVPPKDLLTLIESCIVAEKGKQHGISAI